MNKRCVRLFLLPNFLRIDRAGLRQPPAAGRRAALLTVASGMISFRNLGRAAGGTTRKQRRQSRIAAARRRPQSRARGLCITAKPLARRKRAAAHVACRCRYPSASIPAHAACRCRKRRRQGGWPGDPAAASPAKGSTSGPACK